MSRDDLLERRAWAIRQVVKTLLAAHGTCAAAARLVGAQPSTLARALKRPEGTRYDVVGRLWRAYPLAARMVAEKRQHAAGHTQRPHAVRQHHGANVVCLASYRTVRRVVVAVAGGPAPTGPAE